MLWVVVVLCGIAFPLQFFGYATTCTQGADGSFLTGAVFSAPFLLASSVLLIVAAFKKPRLSSPAPILVALPVIGLTLVVTKSIWLNTIAYGTPCGVLFSGYGSSPALRTMVVVGYLAIPVLNIALCLGLLYLAGKGRQAPARSSG